MNSSFLSADENDFLKHTIIEPSKKNVKLLKKSTKSKTRSTREVENGTTTESSMETEDNQFMKPPKDIDRELDPKLEDIKYYTDYLNQPRYTNKTSQNSIRFPVRILFLLQRKL